MISPSPISFSEAERLSRIFDAENREEWQRTSHILEVLHLQPDTIIADVGAGTGYFSRLLSDRLPRGNVYALDTEPNMLDFMQKRFAKEGRRNIDIRPCKSDDPCLPPDVDVVFMANVYRFITSRQTFLKHLYEQTGDSVRVIIVDLNSEQSQVPPQKAQEEVVAAGFVLVGRDMTGCPNHCILSFGK